MISPFYTYLWLREDGSPYYVGKGRGHRAFRKGSPSRDRIVVQRWLDEATAFAYEKYLIDFWGRKDLQTGSLINLTDGGEGMSLSKESRSKISASLRGNQRHRGCSMPITACQAISKANKGNQNGIGNTSNLGRQLSQKVKLGIREFMKKNGKYFWNDERRTAQAKRMREINCRRLEQMI